MRTEANTSEEREWYYKKRAERCIATLQKNHMAAYYAPTATEACQKALEIIQPGAVIGVGDSVTLFQIGLVKELEKRGGHQIFNPFKPSNEGLYVLGAATFTERLDNMKRALTSDVFVMGTNAITLDGKLVNVDGFGNRVAGLIFGPRKVIIVVGVNKIVRDVTEALQRIKEVATPLNSRRHYKKHGLGSSGEEGSSSDYDESMAAQTVFTVIVERQHQRGPGREPRINVILVGESLGF